MVMDDRFPPRALQEIDDGRFKERGRHGVPDLRATNHYPSSTTPPNASKPFYRDAEIGKSAS
jgi:hypothetical protein